MEKCISYLIDHQCPQCGAPAELSETDRLVQCAYCKVKSFLAEQGCFRYLLPDNAPEDQPLVYFPYWRFKGMLFACLPGGIQNRFLDASRQAVPSSLFPGSVGLRSQAMKLRFVGPEAKGWFIKPTLPFSQMKDWFLQNAYRNAPGPIFHRSHIGESVSLIYAPFYIRDRIMDAILNQPVSALLDEAFTLNQFDGGPADWRIRFIPTLCPNCGWDLHGRRDAVVLHCNNCESMWRATGNGMQRVNAACMQGPGDAATVYLPFWRIQADVSGVPLGTYADLVRLANLPRFIQPAWERIPFHFWCPAFKVRPRSFLRLIHQITLAQPRDGITDRFPKGDTHPVNLPLPEAIETVKLNLFDLLRSKQAGQDRIADIQIKPNRCLLVYLPFAVHHHDLVLPSLNIAVNRNQLALSDNL